MSGLHNGKSMMNGQAWEDGARVEVHYDHRDPEPVNHPLYAPALRYAAGYDPRTLDAISEEIGVSKARLSFAVCQILDRLGIPRTRHKKKAAAPGEENGDKLQTIQDREENQ